MNKIVRMIVYIVVFMLAWNLLDFLFSLVMQNGYQFSVGGNILKPFADAVIFYVIMCVMTYFLPKDKK